MFSCIAPNVADQEETVCCCIETWILIVLGSNLRARLEVIRASIPTLACVGILFADYRLLAADILTAIPAVLLTGLARELEAVTANHIPNDINISADGLTVLLCGGFYYLCLHCLAWR
jgi:hypothetical protein